MQVDAPPCAARKFSCLRKAVVTALLLASAATMYIQPQAARDLVDSLSFTSDPQSAACVQAEPLFPTHALRKELEDLFSSSTFLDQSANWLSGAVKIP